MNKDLTKDLTKGNVVKGIIAFSVPVLIGNLLQQLYNMVDSIIVGRFVGKEAFAAVGSTGSLNFLIIGFVIGICSGLCIPISQKFGAEDMVGVRKKIMTSYYISILLGILLTMLTFFGTRPLLTLMRTPENIFEDAVLYIGIIFLGIPVIILYNLTANILRAIGDSKTPLYFLILSAVLNVILDLWFVIGFSWGVKGTAIATVLAQFLAGILCLFFIYIKYKWLKFQKGACKFEIDSFWNSFNIGLPMGLQFSITAVGSVILQSAVNTLGSDIVAAVNATMKVQMIMTQPMEVIGTSLATFSGQNMGAGKIDRIKEGVKKALIMTIICALAAMLIGNLLVQPMSYLFMRSDELTIGILSNIRLLLFCNSCFYIPLGTLMVFRNTLQGAGYSLAAMSAGVFEMIGRILVAFGLVPIIGFWGVCFANPVAWILANIILIPLYFYLMKKLYEKSYRKDMKNS